MKYLFYIFIYVRQLFMFSRLTEIPGQKIIFFEWRKNVSRDCQTRSALAYIKRALCIFLINSDTNYFFIFICLHTLKQVLQLAHAKPCNVIRGWVFWKFPGCCFVVANVLCMVVRVFWVGGCFLAMLKESTPHL